MMDFNSYVDLCYSIPYSRVSHVTEFGKPMNCYTFVYWAYKLCLGVELDSGDVSSFDSISSVSYNKVEIPMDYDVVNIRVPLDENTSHIGIVVNNTIYHFTEEGLLSKDRFRMAHWIKGYYHVTAQNTKRDI